MASFKEIKERINSVRSTRKITSAMKMVSAAKLHKAQATIQGMLPYSNSLAHVMNNLLAGEGKFDFALTAKRDVKRVAIVAFSSNSAMCGAFNANVAREVALVVSRYAYLPPQDIEIYTVGKKVTDAVHKMGYTEKARFDELSDAPSYEQVSRMAADFMTMFSEGKIDRVELVYHHFKSAGSQILTNEALLPLSLPQSEQTSASTDYILEPSREEILDTLIPKSIKLQLYTVLLDSNASEHAARVIAMQAATDNADDLIGELTVEYNKSRQQAITGELLDMLGGMQN